MFSIGVKPFCGAWHILVFSTDNKIKDDEMTVLKHLTKRLKVSVGVLAVSSTLVGSAFAKNDINIVRFQHAIKYISLDASWGEVSDESCSTVVWRL